MFHGDSEVNDDRIEYVKWMRKEKDDFFHKRRRDMFHDDSEDEEEMIR